MTTIAARVIDALGNFHGMDRLLFSLTAGSQAVVDLQSGTVYSEDAEWPDGERLSADLASGKKISVATHSLVQMLLVRHATAMAVIENTSVRVQYDQICDSLTRKTGFGE